jgi:malic enzyme
MIAADTIAAVAHPTGTGAALLPVADLRTVSTAVAIAVAQAAVEHGLAAQPLTDPRAPNSPSKCGAPRTTHHSNRSDFEKSSCCRCSPGSAA